MLPFGSRSTTSRDSSAKSVLGQTVCSLRNAKARIVIDEIVCTDACIEAVYGALCYMAQSGVWLGAAWWSAGPWWGNVSPSLPHLIIL